jgi:hypothetical protein
MNKTNKQRFKELILKDKMAKFPNFKPEYLPLDIPDDSKANGLTRCVVQWIQLHGFQAERISNTGRVIDNTKTYTDVAGFTKTIGSVKYIKGSGTNGTADISSTIGVNIGGKIVGLSVKWEVKIKDKQSIEQKKYESDIKKSGGLYFIIHNFDEFIEYYDRIIQNYY